MSLADEIKKINDDKVTVPLNCFDELIALALDAIATSTYEQIKKEIINAVSSSNKKVISGEVKFVISPQKNVSKNGVTYGKYEEEEQIYHIKNENNKDIGDVFLRDYNKVIRCTIPFKNNISNIEQLKVKRIGYYNEKLSHEVSLLSELGTNILTSEVCFSTVIKEIQSKMIKLADSDKVKIEFGTYVEKYLGKDFDGDRRYGNKRFCVEGQKVGLRSKLYNDGRIIIRYEYIVS